MRIPFLFRSVFLSILLGFSCTVAVKAETEIIPLEAFARLPDISNLRISPGGDHIAMLKEINGKAHLLVQSIKGSNRLPTLIPPRENFVIQWLEWVNDDWLIFSIHFDNKRFNTLVTETRLLALDMSDRQPINIFRPIRRSSGGGSRISRNDGIGLTGGIPQIQDQVLHILPDEKYKVLVSLDREGMGSDELVEVDVRNGRTKTAFRAFDSIQRWQVDQNAKPRYGFGYKIDPFSTDTKSYYRNANSDDLIDYNQTPAAALNLSPLGYTENPTEVIMLQKRALETSRIVVYDFASNAITRILFENDTISPNGLLRVPKAGGRINGDVIGVTYDDIQTHQLYFDEKWQRFQRSIDRVFPNTANQIVSASEDESILIIFSSSDTKPGTYYLWDRNTNQLGILAEKYPELSSATLPEMQPLTYNAQDGLVIPAYYTAPTVIGDNPPPLVVLPHGGPQARTSKDFDFMTQFLVNRGYAVFQPNFRGSSGYSNAFLNAGNQQWGLAMQDDITDGVHALISQGLADPKRICIFGGSYGGYAALMGAVKTPELYQCAASLNGVTDLPELIRHDKEFIGGNYWTQMIGDTDDDEDKLIQTSPMHNIRNINIPILLLHARDDQRVPYEQSSRFARQLERNGKTVEFVRIDSGGHSLQNAEARAVFLASLGAFLEKHLPVD